MGLLANLELADHELDAVAGGRNNNGLGLIDGPKPQGGRGGGVNLTQIVKEAEALVGLARDIIHWL